MAFPTTPINGQQATVNGITYQYASATNSWARVPGIANTIVASGNITAANFITAGNVSALGNVTVGNLISNGSIVSLGNITGTNLVATGNAEIIGNLSVDSISASTLSGLLTTNGQPNITSVGNLSTLTVIGNVGAGNVITTAVQAITLQGSIVTNAQPNITAVGTLSSLTVSGNLAAGNIASDFIFGTLSTAAQPNITSVGTLTSLSVTGNVSANYFIGNGSQLTGISTTTSEIFNGNSNVAIDSAGANVTMDVNGDANTVVISPGSIFVNGIFASPKTITSNVQMAADSTAMVISPLTIANGYSMSVPTSSTVYIWIPS